MSKKLTYQRKIVGAKFTHDNANELLDVVNGNADSLDAVAEGTPRGNYADLAALITADPDHKYTYLTLDNGELAYYNGTAFVNNGIVYLGHGDVASIADLTILRNSIAEKTDSKIEMLNNSNSVLNVGGGRVLGSYGSYIWNSIGEFKRVRIVGEFLATDENIALYGFYNGVPVSTTFGTPVTTGFVSGASLATPNVLTVIDEIVNVPSGADYLFISQTEGRIINCYKVQDDVILENKEIVNSIVSVLDGKSIFKNDGVLIASGAFQPTPGEGYGTTDFIRFDKIKSYEFKNLVTYKHAGIYGLAFYDKNFQLINTPYAPLSDDNVGQSYFDMDMVSLAALYPNCVYIKASGVIANNPLILSKAQVDMLIRAVWRNKHHILNLFSNCICIGDSTVQGFVTDNPIYEVQPTKAYPAQLAKMAPFPVTNGGLSGASCKSWLATEFSKYNFANFDLVPMEFGYNHDDGDWTLATIDTEGSNGYAYCQIIEGVLAQNPYANIYIIKSSYAKNSDSWSPLLNEISTRYDVPIIDLTDISYINLSANQYHGTHEGIRDYVHFNAHGYNTKAWFILNKIAELHNLIYT